ncbi:MAG: hypothetical protein FWG32_02180 [Oscillospiraceae bacterium]|nr:hypothetical protein [Oscillospiraceae bacterium]
MGYKYKACGRARCRYFGEDTGTCDFILLAGVRRGCAAGPRCRRFMPRADFEGQSHGAFFGRLPFPVIHDFRFER